MDAEAAGRLRRTLAAAAALLLPLGAVALLAPAYLLHRGFPLDDAWIHMVYGRSLATQGMLAYNPGIATVGETSPLWAAVVALPHLLPGAVATKVALVKLAGWALHAAAALVLGLALARIHRPAALVAGLAALLHPELAAAAISGMEVPLAELLLAAQVWGCLAGRPLVFAAAAALAPLGRPETGILAPLVALVLVPGPWRTRLRWALLGAGAAGAGYGAMFLRNRAVSGSFLPATFHAKVEPGLEIKRLALARSLRHLLPSLLPLPAWGLPLFAAALAWRGRPGRGPEARLARLAGAGLLLVAVCGTLRYPSEIPAFYHRRYLLPGLPFLLAGAADLLAAAGGGLRSRWRGPGAARILPVLPAAAWILALAAFWPARFRHLDNDARNIDEVQVALGRSLAGAPASLNLWAVDAGASRYFGGPFVVDTAGLNTPAFASETEAPAFLAAHPAHFLELVPTWNTLKVQAADTAALRVRRFTTAPPFTVTLRAATATHLLAVADRPVEGRLYIFLNRYPVSLRPPEP